MAEWGRRPGPGHSTSRCFFLPPANSSRARFLIIAPAMDSSPSRKTCRGSLRDTIGASLTDHLPSIPDSRIFLTASDQISIACSAVFFVTKARSSTILSSLNTVNAQYSASSRTPCMSLFIRLLFETAHAISISPPCRVQTKRNEREAGWILRFLVDSLGPTLRSTQQAR